MKKFISKYKVIPAGSVIGATSTHIVNDKLEGNFSLSTERNWSGISLSSIIKTYDIQKVSSDVQFIKEFTFTNNSVDGETFFLTFSYVVNSQKFNKNVKYVSNGIATPTQIATKLKDTINSTMTDFIATSVGSVLTVTMRYDIIDVNPTVISGTNSKTTTITENQVSYAAQQSDIEQLLKNYEGLTISDFNSLSRYNTYLIKYDVLTYTVHGNVVEEEYAAFFIEESVIYLSLIESIKSSGSYEAVNVGLSANRTNNTTTAILEYGVNVFTIADLSNYACKLPQPILGKTVKIINKTSRTILLYPSNVGGQINNYPINSPAIIPPNGVAYDFVCIENPLPGNWSWNPPNAYLYDSGIVSATVSSDVLSGYRNPKVSASNSSDVVVGVNTENGFEAFSWGYDGRNHPDKIIDNSYIAFRTIENWLSIQRILIQTNCTANSIFQLSIGYYQMYYATANTGYGYSAGDIITNGVALAGPMSLINKQMYTISGTPTLPGEFFQPNIGDPGTVYFEADVAMIAPVIGRLESGPIPSPQDFQIYSTLIPQGTEVELHTSGLMSFQIQPNTYEDYGSSKDFKFRYFLEYTT